jgi:hypothetical protein
VIVQNDFTNSTVTPGSTAATRDLVWSMMPMIEAQAARSFGGNMGLRRSAGIRR